MKISALLLCGWLAAAATAQDRVSLVEHQKALAIIDELRVEINILKQKLIESGVPVSTAINISSAPVKQAPAIYTAAQELELSRLSDAEEAELNPQSRFDDAWLVGKHRIGVKQPLVSTDGNLVIKVRDTRAGGVGAGICSILLVSNGAAQLKRYAVRDQQQFSFAGHYYRFAIEKAESKACLLSVQRRS